MFKQISDMPPGTIGFEAVGEIDDDDFDEVVAPVLRQQMADGRKVRLLYPARAAAPRIRGRCGAGGAEIRSTPRHRIRARRCCQ